jgi:hypothetical protein
MERWQQGLLLIYFTFAVWAVIRGVLECLKGRVYGEKAVLNLIGAFVWGDAVVLGLFWVGVVLGILWLKDWLLFWLIQSVFWLVRSIGETIYWFNEQFAVNHRNPPSKFILSKIFSEDSVWFINQLGWQCLTVITAITTLYLAHFWLKGK